MGSSWGNPHADQFRAIRGQILAYEYTLPLNAVKEWSYFDHMELLSL
jgi:hypothetical protein